MKKSNLLYLFFIPAFLFGNLNNLDSQVPQGFNYQAIARDNSGNPITNTTLKVKLSILSDSTGFYSGTGGTYVWEEEHSNVKTNSFGMFTVVLGSPAAVKIQGTAPTFSAVNWSVANLYIGTKIAQAPGYIYKVMGSAKLWSVPYSMMANDISGALKKLTVTGETNNMEEALFEVKNINGQTVFAVYNEGVRVYVDDGAAKGTKGGFAIGSFDQAKGSQEYFVVNSDCVRVYIDKDPGKAVKGGFAIGSFNPAKAGVDEYLRVTDDSTRIYVSESSKGVKGGFAIGSFNNSKSPVTNYVNLTPNNYLIGQEAGGKITNGLYNTFMGYQAGKENNDGSSNVFIGYLAGEKNTSGSGNIFLGVNAGQDFQQGFNNTYIGSLAGQNFPAGNSNIFIGRNAGSGYNFPTGQTPGSNNIVIGNFSAYYLNTGLNNVFMGNMSGFWNTSGYENLFSGNSSGYGNVSGFENVFLGSSAGYNNTTGHQNVYLGTRSGYNNQTGYRNVFIGIQAGYSLSSGDGNVFIGAGAGGSDANQSDRLYIENSAVNSTSALIYGEFDNDYLRLNANTDVFGRLGIGKNAVGARLDVAASNWDVLNTEGDLRIGDGNYRFKVGVSTAGGGAGDVRLTAHGGTNRLILGGGGKEVLALTATQIYPWSDNTFSLGLPSYRWTTIYAVNGTINTSDARLKTNVASLDYGINEIMKLRPVSYNWIDKPEGRKMLGLIAQDVASVIVEVVDKGNDSFQTLGINYSELIPVLINGIQEQQKIIRNQQQQIETLIERISAIEAMVGNR
ncbi:MAG: hypothetical protein GYA43_02500 [Bacteroidales bacterium]|nr:hypothetical protein [Bacteroidales bacterium]